ncbi:MAG: four helix bundle protein [Bacteroidaceae bacterium]|nr:four helix bundle protein [Bacteroidaceae bacterium]MBR4779522.1 four helix bundle protein [Bacteroidaceae bacterium]
MQKENVVLTKGEDFAVRIINLYKHLVNEKKEYVLSKQILRSGTSIGANVSEAICGISKKDFLAKMHIAFKECNETLYWLRLLFRSDYINEKEFESIETDCKELIFILSSITKSTSESLNSDLNS